MNVLADAVRQHSHNGFSPRLNPASKIPTNSRKLLVTTALESTWGKTENILFLGEWCKLYERRHICAQRDHETVRFHWNDRDKLKRDYDYLQSLHHSFLECLAASLNEFHQVDYSVRYWQILLDPWLMSYVAVVFDRWECLRIAFEQNDEIEIILPEEISAAVPPFSYSEFIARAPYSDEWNHALYQRIIESEHSGHCVIRRENISIGGETKDVQISASSAPRSALSRFALWVDRLLGCRFSKYKVVFLSSYFSWPSLIRLNLAIGQMPRLFLDEFKLDEASSDSLPSSAGLDRSGMRLNFQARSAFEEFINQSIIHDIPRCLVESYGALRDRARSVSTRTKAIVTANNHWTNVHAKAWMAEQTNKGVKLVILEHGGSFPAYKELFDFEEDVADIKATWYLPYHKKHTQLPPSKLVAVFKKALPRAETSLSRKYCSIIGNEYPRYVYRAHYYPMAAQCLVSLNLAVRLYKGLDEEVKQVFRVKPYPDQGWNTRQRYSDILGPERMLAESKLNRVFCLSKLIVCTYPETTFSEAMASGIPTVMIYPEHLYERHPVAFSLLEMLRSARIIFHDPMNAAAHINAIWKDPAQWWSRADVLHVRNEFLRQGLRIDGAWLKEWVPFLKSVVA